MTPVQVAAVPKSVKEQSSTHPRGFHIPSLDGIRGVAFLLVFVSHAGLRKIVPGGFGVTIFFVLSGYLITTLLRVEHAETGRIDLKAFYVRRTFRILPLFYIVLLMAYTLRLAGQVSGNLEFKAVVCQVFQVSNYYLISHPPTAVVGGTIVLWSLAVEEHFYLLFPQIYRILLRRLSPVAQAGILALACAGCLLWRYVLIYLLHAPSVRTELGTDTRFDCLLVGAIMAIAANPALDAARWLSRKYFNVTVPLSLAALLLTFLIRDENFRSVLRYSVQAVSLLPLFCYAIQRHESLTYRILNSALMTRLGVLSYGLYLIHAIVLDWYTVHLHTAQVALAMLTLVSSLIVATMLQVTVEKPLQVIRKKYNRVTPVTSGKLAA